MANGNMSDDQEEATEPPAGGGGMQLELLKSYLSFARRAIRKRLLIVIAILGVGVVVTAFTLKYFPRTFVCTTVMMAEGNQVLEDWQPAPFGAAYNLVMRRANLEALVRETQLAKKFVERRPPILKLKDDTMQRLFGAWDEETRAAFMVPALESRLSVNTDGPTMTVSAAWSDPLTAKELAEAAQQSFLKARHNSDTAAFQEKMAILDGHATKLRDEIEQLAEEIHKGSGSSKGSAEPARDGKKESAGAAPRPVAVRSAPRRAAAVDTAPDPGQAEQREKLEAMRRKLADLDNERERRLREERAKLEDLKLRLNSSHPAVITAQQRIGLLEQDPSESALLRAEVKDLQLQITQRDSMAKQAALGAARSSGGGGAAVAQVSEPLPAAITEILRENDADPAMLAQLSGAITRYGVLRDQIRAARIDLDTVNAAFNQRYKVLVPPEVPGRPVKPNPVAILGGGLGIALLIAFLLPILAELRTGIIVERWQVQMVQLPVLAEIRLPPRSND